MKRNLETATLVGLGVLVAYVLTNGALALVWWFAFRTGVMDF